MDIILVFIVYLYLKQIPLFAQKFARRAGKNSSFFFSLLLLLHPYQTFKSTFEMKLVTKEEREAHFNHILTEAGKGLFYGAVLSTGIFFYLKKRHTARFNTFNTSIKTCIFCIPTIGMGALWADNGSVEFDKLMYSSDYSQSKVMEEHREWAAMSTSDRIITGLNSHKYKIILGAWAGSLYGSWVLVNRDKIMTTAQKAVQARMYAQAISILLLLGTIVLAMKEEEINKSKPPPIPEWRKVLMQKEAEEKELLEEIKRAKAKAETIDNKSN